MADVKQVIVMRKDLGMRKGKMIAQGAHASMGWLRSRLYGNGHPKPGDPSLWIHLDDLDSDITEGFFTGMTKICVSVDTEAQLLDIESRAREAGLQVHLITDAGRTEFNGVPTKTCLAIGPDLSESIDKITGSLKLL